MYHYLVFVPLALIFSAAALALPWFIVRAGYRDLVQITCACVSVLGLCAATGAACVSVRLRRAGVLFVRGRLRDTVVYDA